MKEMVWAHSFFVSIILTIYPGTLTLGLKDVEIILPRYVRQGLDVRGFCKYDLEEESLYAVKWYFYNEEFFRYLPKEVPPGLSFKPPGIKLPGISVDVNLSNDHEVLLRNVSLEVSGNFRCVVAAEFPFPTLVASSDMTVVVIEDDEPILELDRAQYHPGDRVSAECRSPPTFPPANITWFIDDVKADRLSKTDKLGNQNYPVKKSTLSKISFDLPEKVSPVGIKCRVTLFTVYDKNSTTTFINPVPRRLTGTENLLRPGTSTASQSQVFTVPHFTIFTGIFILTFNLCLNPFSIIIIR